MTKSITPIHDVARPNESAPGDTSVPVIVNNRPILRDPMMASDVPNVGKPVSENAPLSPVSSHINIQPISADVPKVPEKEVAPIEETVPEQSEVSPLSVEGTVSGKATADKATSESENVAKQETILQTLVTTKKYFLPINTVESRRTKRFMLIGIVVSILLTVVWIDIALDAGIIKIGGLKALTHIFST